MSITTSYMALGQIFQSIILRLVYIEVIEKVIELVLQCVKLINS